MWGSSIELIGEEIQEEKLECVYGRCKKRQSKYLQQYINIQCLANEQRKSVTQMVI